MESRSFLTQANAGCVACGVGLAMKLPKFLNSAGCSNVAELGANHVALGRFAVRAGTIVLERFGFEPVQKTRPTGGGENDAAILAVGAAGDRIGVGGALALVVPSHVSLTKFVEVPELPRTKLRKVVQFEAEQQIPYPLSEVVWDYAVIAETSGRLDVVLAAAKLEAIQTLCSGLDEEGFQVERATPAGIALAHAFRHNYPEIEDAALVVEVGSRSTLLLFIDSKRFFVRAITITCHAATNASRESDADFCRRLQQEVSRSLVMMRRQAILGEPSRVYLAGEEVEMNTFAPLFEDQCKCRVERFDALRRVEVSSDAEASGARKHASRLASFVGVGLIASKHLSGVPNLVPKRWSREVSSRRRVPPLIAAAGLIGVAMLPAIWHFRGVEQRERERIHELDASLHSLRAFATKNAEHLIAIEQLEKEIARAKAFANSQTSWVRFFADLQARLTVVEGVWFERLVVDDRSDQWQPDEQRERQASEPLRLAVSGRLIDPKDESEVRSSSHEKVKQLLTSLRGSEFVEAIEGERFDGTEPDVFRFDFTIVARADSRL